MGIAKLIDLAILFLFTTLKFSLAEKPPSRSAESDVKDYRFIVGIGFRKENIFCLGAIVSQSSILSLASCFDEYEYDDYDNDVKDGPDSGISGADANGEDDVGRKSRSRHQQLGMKRHKRKSEIDFSNDDHHGAGDDGSFGADVQDDGDDDDHSPGSITTTDELEQSTEKPKKYSLYRIDSELQVFVRLRAMVGYLAVHPEYEKVENVSLWKHNLGMLFVMDDGHLDFGVKKKIRPIELYASRYGNYMKSTNEEMINADNCQVIGIIEYQDRKPYTPKDTDVTLAAHLVLVDYDACNSTVCSSLRLDCTETGHHIYREPSNLLPYFYPGSSLVCQGKLLSIVNIHSHCDDSRYSAEYASPGTTSFFTKEGFVAGSEQGGNDADFPKSRWIANASPQDDRILGNLDLAFATVANWLRIQITG